DAEHGPAAFAPSVPDEQQFAPQGQSSIHVFDDELIYVRYIHPESHGLAAVVSKPYDFRVDNGFHALHELAGVSHTHRAHTLVPRPGLVVYRTEIFGCFIKSVGPYMAEGIAGVLERIHRFLADLA